MIKKEIYPKTKRMAIDGIKIQVTEKLDGSNLVIFKKDEKIYFAQRNTILRFDEIEENKDKLYKGLYQWLIDNMTVLQEELYEGSALCGEWLGMGKLKYDISEFDKRFYMFAKARVNSNFELENIMYDHDLFIYPFASQKIPTFIGIVPVVADIQYLPNKQNMDKLYLNYVTSRGRAVEGFVINNNDNVIKYVRYKNGQLVDYSDTDHKGA